MVLGSFGGDSGVVPDGSRLVLVVVLHQTWAIHKTATSYFSFRAMDHQLTPSSAPAPHCRTQCGPRLS